MIGRKNRHALIEQLLSLDYELFWHLPFLFNPKNFFGQTANVFEGIVSINMLGVPREAKRNATGFRAVTGPHDWPFAKLICL